MSSGRHSVCVCFYSVCILSVCIEFCVCVGSHALTPLPLTHEIPWLEDGARDSSYSPGPRGFKREGAWVPSCRHHSPYFNFLSDINDEPWTWGLLMSATHCAHCTSAHVAKVLGEKFLTFFQANNFLQQFCKQILPDEYPRRSAAGQHVQNILAIHGALVWRMVHESCMRGQPRCILLYM